MNISRDYASCTANISTKRITLYPICKEECTEVDIKLKRRKKLTLLEFLFSDVLSTADVM
jgi:predicted nucleic acid-binding Zn ribbon protein